MKKSNCGKCICNAFFTALAIGSFPFSASHAIIKDTADMSSILNGLACTWNGPIGSNTTGQDDGGPEVGNGGYGIAVGGTANNIRLWMAESGLFQPGNGDYRGMGYVNISSNGTESGGGSYSMHQYLRQAYATTSCTMSGQTINSKIWISDSDNVAFCELTNAGSSAVNLKAVLVSYDGDASTGSTGGDSVAWVSKDLSGLWGAVRYAMVMKRFGGAGSVSAAGGGSATLTFTINAGQTANLVFKVGDNWKAGNNPKDSIVSFIRPFSANDNWWSNHVRYWNNFWYKSYVKFSNVNLERWWYGHLYWIGSASRQGPTNYAPVTWGIWTRGVSSDWAELWGNYNGEAPFYGLASANHLEVLQPYVKALATHQTYAVGRVAWCNAHPTDDQYMGTYVRSKMPTNLHGGLNNCIFNGRGLPGQGTLLGHGIWNQPTDGVLQLTPAVMYYKYSMDSSFYADTLYTILKNQADLLTDYVHNIGKTNGKYQIWGCAHEDQWCQNSTYDIEWVQYIMKEMMAASISQNKDAASRPIWQGIIDSLQPVLTTTRNGQTIISESVQKPTWSDGNLNCVLLFVAAGAVSAGTDPNFLAEIRNTLRQTNSWGGGCAYCLVTSMGAKCLYNPDSLVQLMTNRSLLTSLHTNDGGAGGMEVCGLIDGINSLVLQSQDDTIRLFPDCPASLDAKFEQLRTVGAFLVDAHHTSSNTIDDAVYVYSEAGKTCNVKNPWPGQAVTILNNGSVVASTKVNDIYTFNTIAGQTYQIKLGAVSVHNPVVCSLAPSLKIVGITERKSDVVIVFNGSNSTKEYAVAVYSLNGKKVYATTVPNSGSGTYSVIWNSGTSFGLYVASIRSESASIERRFTIK
jgi:alpha-L-fucosidase 2